MVIRKVFIGSSTEALPIARALALILAEMKESSIVPVVWDEDNVWKRDFTLDSLVQASKQYEFGIFIISPDDGLLYRDREEKTARINVWFEAGLFISSNGKQSVFLLVNKKDTKALHIPSDLFGCRLELYETSNPANPDHDELRNVARKIAHRIDEIVKGNLIEEIEGAKPIFDRDECYETGIKLVKKARQKVYTVLSYDDELEGKNKEGESPHRVPGTKENRLFLALLEKSKEPGITIKRYMNLSNRNIAEQAIDILKSNINILEGQEIYNSSALNANTQSKIKIMDTFCHYVEVIITEEQVLIVLPDFSSKNQIKVGVGVLITSEVIANHFSSWFENLLCEKNQIPIRVDNLKKYREEIVIRNSGPRAEKCPACEGPHPDGVKLQELQRI